jgi:pimeloyl-ACP methyl ester carboxylesterase
MLQKSRDVIGWNMQPRCRPVWLNPVNAGRALVGLFLLGLSWSAVGQALKPCRVAGIETEVQCATLTRPLDPARPQGVSIEVHYVVVPAIARRKHPDPIFFLAGGPGQSAIALAPQVMRQMARLNNRRDLVFIDQRGTGQSAPLVCDDERHQSLADRLDSIRRNAALTHCLAQLQQLPYGDLRFFTTVLASQDLDAVRQALGVTQVNLISGSYGTRAALDYARQFPAAVRRSVLDGVAPADMVLPASASVDAQAAFDALLTACENEASCAQAHPALRLNWSRLLGGIPTTVWVLHPLTGQRAQVTFDREMLLSLVRQPLYSPVAASALPVAIDAAAQGEFAPLLGLGFNPGGRRSQAPAMGMHFSVVCSEDYPRMARSPDVPGKDFGAEFAQMYAGTCAQWPRAEVPAAFYTLPVAASATLLLSGGLDPVTPPRHGARVAMALGAKARHVVVPNGGHGVMALGCMRDVLARFIDAQDDDSALAVDTQCVDHLPRPNAFVPLASLPP